jgi:starch phosphorylase
MQEQNISFNDALKQASQSLVFTNHTLKSAGNDIFDYMLFEKYLQPYASEIKTDVNTLFNLGDDKTYSQGGFSMTIFGLRHAKVSNAVSKLHATAAANIWHEYSLTPVTNGVHMPTWVSPEIHKLLDQYLGEEWHYASTDMDFQRILKIPKQLLWEAHNIRKQKLIHSLNSELGLSLKPDILTIAWSRRLAQYKRPDLLISDVERLKAIVASTDKPVQILIAGKSHPKDTIGKQILQKMNQYFENEFFNNKVEIIPGYNWQLARRMVSGADIWLNTPYRYEEACGTSGMKAAANGVIQLTTKDGWTDEVDWFRIGWVISEQDSADSLYSLLQNDIVPLYYNKNESGFNEDWLSMMLNSIQLSLQNFSAERMVRDYLDKIYNQVL